MHGNVWEWVQDSWHDNYVGAPANGTAWIKGDDNRVLRGGSWYDPPHDLRSTSRELFTTDYRGSYVGFRVVCSPPSVR